MVKDNKQQYAGQSLNTFQIPIKSLWGLKPPYSTGNNVTV